MTCGQIREWSCRGKPQSCALFASLTTMVGDSRAERSEAGFALRAGLSLRDALRSQALVPPPAPRHTCLICMGEALAGEDGCEARASKTIRPATRASPCGCLASKSSPIVARSAGRKCKYQLAKPLGRLARLAKHCASAARCEMKFAGGTPHLRNPPTTNFPPPQLFC